MLGTARDCRGGEVCSKSNCEGAASCERIRWSLEVTEISVGAATVVGGADAVRAKSRRKRLRDTADVGADGGMAIRDVAGVADVADGVSRTEGKARRFGTTPIAGRRVPSGETADARGGTDEVRAADAGRGSTPGECGSIGLGTSSEMGSSARLISSQSEKAEAREWRAGDVCARARTGGGSRGEEELPVGSVRRRARARRPRTRRDWRRGWDEDVGASAAATVVGLAKRE